MPNQLIKKLLKKILSNIVKTKKPTRLEKTKTDMMFSDLNKDKIKIDTKIMINQN